ncbi:CDP-diacylglycerol--glycerol-3-phosphate 3-phosphatidyltransferase [Rhodopirellula sallentina]|uniref:CDP-diacylglycerol--glycerol-3-phosphate 3-phosphatidyltransferase n=1 Tax=Rhodopirellula sallentina SM41 TaxID=1263870 RepID=M5TWQ9_9BACT|nr:CDP-diacylglycerol--glycerol-3-phosphate 3-phosphatidyltransferase [Rhodopirellula sallentina]EMI53610.1 CDP-diacylglycerol--glycerol-3-phosphate 3-phosphatidyltransferase [Rhodopirellula sallentina SM41]
MPSPSIYNVPNALTTVRFALAIAVVVLIPMRETWPALVVFLIAVSTDWMDGYWARKYGQVTKLGRIFDPFVDKIIICGSFIALVEVDDSPVKSWMATVVVARELLVTSLRGIIEGAGGDFSASWLGKWKMVVQCAAVVAALLTFVILPVPAWLSIATQVLLWGAIFITVYSGVDYTLIAARVMQSSPQTLTQAAATPTTAADAIASESAPDEPAVSSPPAPRQDETTADSLSDRT